MREAHTDVLVVGAGPIGLWTALLLAEAGVQVSVVDREPGVAARTYACALHPRTLKLLDGIGLAGSVLEQARRIQKVGFFDGAERRAEVDLRSLGGDYPFLAILPQHALENVLEQRLRRAGVQVYWNHRLVDLGIGEESVEATVEQLAGTSTGYIVPHWETVVKERTTLGAQFVIGTDGQNSTVRRLSGIETQKFGSPQFFVAFEFESDPAPDAEIRVVLGPASTSVLWPLARNEFRWTFQLVRSEGVPEFPLKERRAVRVAKPEVDSIVRQYIQTVAQQLAPWFSARIGELTWSSEVAFESRLVPQFGRNRIWLAGDAAHQTGPVGVQSMNMGFVEGAALSRRIDSILRGSAALESLEDFNQEHQEEWRRLLGLEHLLTSGTATNPWVAERSSRLLPCLPGTDGDLQELAAQLGLSFAK